LGEQEQELACLVKLYDLVGDGESTTFNVNGMFDFIGILSVDTVLADFNSNDTGMDMDDAFLSEYVAHNPPPSKVPRLHCVCYRPVAPQSPILPCGLYRSTGSGSGAKEQNQGKKEDAMDEEDDDDLDIQLPLYPNSAAQATALMQSLSTSNTWEQTRAWIIEALASALGGDRMAGEYVRRKHIILLSCFAPTKYDQCPDICCILHLASFFLSFFLLLLV
jgi:hypothetical protein